MPSLQRLARGEELRSSGCGLSHRFCLQQPRGEALGARKGKVLGSLHLPGVSSGGGFEKLMAALFPPPLPLLGKNGNKQAGDRKTEGQGLGGGWGWGLVFTVCDRRSLKC